MIKTYIFINLIFSLVTYYLFPPILVLKLAEKVDTTVYTAVCIPTADEDFTGIFMCSDFLKNKKRLVISSCIVIHAGAYILLAVPFVIKKKLGSKLDLVWTKCQ